MTFVLRVPASFVRESWPQRVVELTRTMREKGDAYCKKLWVQEPAKNGKMSHIPNAASAKARICCMVLRCSSRSREDAR